MDLNGWQLLRGSVRMPRRSVPRRGAGADAAAAAGGVSCAHRGWRGEAGDGEEHGGERRRSTNGWMGRGIPGCRSLARRPPLEARRGRGRAGRFRPACGAGARQRVGRCEATSGGGSMRPACAQGWPCGHAAAGIGTGRAGGERGAAVESVVVGGRRVVARGCGRCFIVLRRGGGGAARRARGRARHGPSVRRPARRRGERPPAGGGGSRPAGRTVSWRTPAPRARATARRWRARRRPARVACRRQSRAARRKPGAGGVHGEHAPAATADRRARRQAQGSIAPILRQPPDAGCAAGFRLGLSRRKPTCKISRRPPSMRAAVSRPPQTQPVSRPSTSGRSSRPSADQWPKAIGVPAVRRPGASNQAK